MSNTRQPQDAINEQQRKNFHPSPGTFNRLYPPLPAWLSQHGTQWLWLESFLSIRRRRDIYQHLAQRPGLADDDLGGISHTPSRAGDSIAICEKFSNHLSSPVCSAACPMSGPGQGVPAFLPEVGRETRLDPPGQTLAKHVQLSR